MTDAERAAALEKLPFFLPQPGETDLLFILVGLAVFGIVIGFGALYFTIQAWPDRLAKGAGKVQLQLVGVLGIISLITFDNIYWIIGLLLAAIRLPDVVTPIRSIARSLARATAKEG